MHIYKGLMHTFTPAHARARAHTHARTRTHYNLYNITL